MLYHNIVLPLYIVFSFLDIVKNILKIFCAAQSEQCRWTRNIRLFAPSTGTYVVGKPEVVLVSYADLLRMEVTALGRAMTGFIIMGRLVISRFT